ncbi:class I mannose-6-phosphate isomerase [Caproiciproducens sp. CPB-2]|uniref:class I mannose-6-phosphate isomerase n=1 Tax=Caproiciproducens sp. CPB-2 TaxID=3030017 RepID=UPI0023D98C49|nr:class I mannose-6-phosphate isomerase [Caproiciproducens sp. CPB-2]MDF1493152.1 class I mannose-6-phosphate isomerase [Caproiciproducens sp. CPB-2]
MYFEHRTPNYEKFPIIRVEGHDRESWGSYQDFAEELKRRIKQLGKRKQVLVADFYHGVRHGEVLSQLLSPLGAKETILCESAKLAETEISQKLKRNITDDRVFGVLSTHKIEEFYDAEKLKELRKRVDAVEEGLVVVYGIGASLVTKGDLLVYADMPRWEIQQRFRSHELDNWGVGNFQEDTLRKYKRAFFIEWRVLDRHKRSLYQDMDYVLDTTAKGCGKAITGEAFRNGIEQAARKPFRLMPYFDEGVWGGRWMEEVCDLAHGENNMAWCFDGVPEENSVLLRVGDVTAEVPSINIVFMRPDELLGPKVHARFGLEFPIRFDFLDTMGGGNLSLQVHPLTEYIQENFGMHYTQDESYYILDAGPDACAYLGLKDGVVPEELIGDLKNAQGRGETFDDSKYINKFPIKKHDHVLIPAGTIHCSGKNAMVLEISATPYIFTFKLWDWGRVGLDGIPRPVHVDHGSRVIQYNRTTEWVETNLLHREKEVAQGDGWREEQTGLHELEFIETRRHWFTKPVTHNTNGSVNVLNLIEGEEALVESPTCAFEPYVVHYAETFIVPAAVGTYTIRPYGKSEGKEIATIKASVRI